MSSPTPTQEQIQTVQTNLTNMQALNDYIYTHGLAKIQNAYLLLSEPDNNDPGLTVDLNILEGAFWAVGSLGGMIGNFAASFLSGMVSYWATSTPPDLNGQFASYVTRFEQTTLDVDTQLATYYQNVAAHWNDQFTYNGKTTTLADLSTASFPAETDPTFEQMAGVALFALDQTLWKQMLVNNYVITLWELSSGPTIMPGKEDDPTISWAQDYYKSYPAYYETWSWHKSSGCGDQTGWETTEYNIGTGASFFHDGSLNSDACQYLFIDSTPGTTINANGLFTRETVFTGLGLKQKTYLVATGGGGATAEQLSVGYLRAMKQGQTIGQLIEREGRETVEGRLIHQAHQDSVFAHNLTYRPRQTLEEFLGVKIPDVVSVSVIVETPRTFGIVVPMAAPNQDEG